MNVRQTIQLTQKFQEIAMLFGYLHDFMGMQLSISQARTHLTSYSNGKCYAQRVLSI